MRVCVLCLLLCFAHLCLRRGGQNSVWLGGWVVGFSFVPSFARSFVPAFIRSFVGCVRSFVFVLLDLCVVLHCSLVCRMVRLQPTHARTHARALTRSHHVCIMSGGRGGGDVMSFVPSFLPACLRLGRPCCLHAVRSLTHWLSCTRLLVRSFVPCSFLRSCVRSRLLTRAARGSCELSLSLLPFSLLHSPSPSPSLPVYCVRGAARRRGASSSVSMRACLVPVCCMLGKAASLGGCSEDMRRSMAWLGLAWLGCQ